jgi:hypothetical protein
MGRNFCPIYTSVVGFYLLVQSCSLRPSLDTLVMSEIGVN